jgi:hypothetical protein
MQRRLPHTGADLGRHEKEEIPNRVYIHLAVRMSIQTIEHPWEPGGDYRMEVPYPKALGDALTSSMFPIEAQSIF